MRTNPPAKNNTEQTNADQSRQTKLEQKQNRTNELRPDQVIPGRPNQNRAKLARLAQT